MLLDHAHNIIMLPTKIKLIDQLTSFRKE